MRSLWFMPLTFVAGIDGFGWFVPYLLVVSAIAALWARARQNPQRPGRFVRLPSPNLSELEAAPT